MGRIKRGGGDGGDPARGPPSRDYPLGQTCENYLAWEPERLTQGKDVPVHQFSMPDVNCSEFNGLEESFEPLDCLRGDRNGARASRQFHIKVFVSWF